MKRKKIKVIVAVFMMSLLVGGHTVKGERVDGEDSILILGNKSLEPLVYEKNGKAEGLTVEIIEELEGRIGTSINIKAMDWSKAQKLLEKGEADALMQINETDERKMKLDFSEPVLESEISVFTNNPGLKLSGIDDLEGFDVGIEKDGFPELLLKSEPEINLVEMPSLYEGLQKLKRGEIDAVVTDRWAGSYMLATHKIDGIWITGEPIAKQDTHIAVKKGNADLLSSIDKGLKDMKADGTYQRIIDGWESKETVFHTKEQASLYRLKIGIGALSIVAIVMAGSGIVLIRQLRRSKEIGQELSAEKERFKTILFSVGDGVISIDGEGKIVVMNTVAEKLTGWSLGEASGKPFDMVFRTLYEHGSQKRLDIGGRVLETGEDVELDENTMLISKDGKEIFIDSKTSPIKSDTEKIIGAVTVFRDFTEKREKQKQIEYLSFCDQLTGLHSRYFFEKELKRLDEKGSLPVGMILLDVNGLKLVNDAFGHSEGDRLLRKVSETLRKECGSDNTLCRIGGDEFVILLPRTDELQIKRTVERISKSLSNNTIESIPITGSCGWSIKRYLEESMSELFKKAEDDMYHNKTSEKKSIRYSSIQIIMKTLFEKTSREEAHSERVSELCMEIAQEMGMDQGEANMLKTAGLLHDIGKIAVGNDILDKDGQLDDFEWSEIKKHPEISYNILSSVNDYGPLAEVALSHHERWDGKGYPRKLSGTEIPLHSRIVAIADSYDAMTSDRSYRKAMSSKAAWEEIETGAGRQFDPELVEIFRRVLERGSCNLPDSVEAGEFIGDLETLAMR